MSKHRRPLLISVPEEDSSSRSWEDFDHSQTLVLGHSGLTCIVYKRETFGPHILQSCEKDNAGQHLLLVKMARDSDLFIPMYFIFSHRDNIYIGSKVAGISLANVIDCTIPLTEVHASSILKKVKLYYVMAQGFTKCEIGCSSPDRGSRQGYQIQPHQSFKCVSIPSLLRLLYRPGSPHSTR